MRSVQRIVSGIHGYRKWLLVLVAMVTGLSVVGAARVVLPRRRGTTT